MRHCRNRWQSRALGCAVWTMGFALWCAGLSSAQSGDPVEDLRQALRRPVGTTEELQPNAEDLKARQAAIEKTVRALHTIGDLRRALALQEWRDEDLETKVADVDRELREDVAIRLRKGLEQALQDKDPAVRLAALTSIGEIGTNIRGGGTLNLARGFGPEVIKLVNDPNRDVSEAAALSLSHINWNPPRTARVLANLLASDDLAERRIGAEALDSMIRLRIEQTQDMSVRYSFDTPPEARHSKVQATKGEVLDVAPAVVSVMGPGLEDRDPQVLRQSLDAVYLAANIDPRKLIEKEPGEFQALAQALKKQAPRVARLLSDAQVANRLTAARTLEGMGYFRLRLLGRSTSMPAGLQESSAPADSVRRVADDEAPPPRPVPEEASSKTPDQLLLEGLLAAVPELSAAAADSDPEVRLAAVNALENIGPAATAAIPALVKALSDRNVFVRWVAARSVGKFGPDKASDALPGLIRLLSDNDVDVRLAALGALERFGPHAADAVAGLTEAVSRGDASARAAAAHALANIGPRYGRSAIPTLREVLEHDDARVRVAVAEALGRLQADDEATVAALRRALHDSDADVRQTAGDALLNILHPLKSGL